VERKWVLIAQCHSGESASPCAPEKEKQYELRQNALPTDRSAQKAISGEGEKRNDRGEQEKKTHRLKPLQPLDMPSREGMLKQKNGDNKLNSRTLVKSNEQDMPLKHKQRVRQRKSKVSITVS